MPITFPAHAAAILPLTRWRRLPGTALLVGSAVPDFAFLIRGEAGRFSHSASGLLLLCLPVGLLTYALFEGVLFPALRRSGRPLSVGLASRGIARTAREWVAATSAILLGAVTHVVWDRFTHGDRWPGAELFGDAGAARAHLISSVAGSLLVLAWSAAGYLRRSGERRAPGERNVGLALAIAGGLGAGTAWVMHVAVSGVDEIFTRGWSLFAGALIATSLVAFWLQRGQPPPAERLTGGP